MQSNSSSSDSRSDSRNESQYDSCSSDENIDLSSKISKKPERKRSDGKASVKRRQDGDRKKPVDREKVSTPIKERHHLQNEKTKVQFLHRGEIPPNRVSFLEAWKQMK